MRDATKPFGLATLVALAGGFNELHELLRPFHELRDDGVFASYLTDEARAELHRPSLTPLPFPAPEGWERVPVRLAPISNDLPVLPIPFDEDDLLQLLAARPDIAQLHIERQFTNDPIRDGALPEPDLEALGRLAIDSPRLASFLQKRLAVGGRWWTVSVEQDKHKRGLSPSDEQRLIQRLAQGGTTIAAVAREFKISRRTAEKYAPGGTRATPSPPSPRARKADSPATWASPVWKTAAAKKPRKPLG